MGGRGGDGLRVFTTVGRLVGLGLYSWRIAYCVLRIAYCVLRIAYCHFGAGGRGGGGLV